MKQSTRRGEWESHDDYDGWSSSSDQGDPDTHQMDESSAWDDDDVNIDINDDDENESFMHHQAPFSETEHEEEKELQHPSTPRELQAYHRKRNRGRRWNVMGGEGHDKDFEMVSSDTLGESCDDNNVPRHSPVKHEAPVEKTGVAVELLGFDLSALSPRVQFATCAFGNLGLTVVYGYLQEMLSVHVFHREYPLFFAACQFGIYAAWAWYLRLMSTLPSADCDVASMKGGVNTYPSLRAKNSCDALSDAEDDSDDEGSHTVSTSLSNDPSESDDGCDKTVFRDDVVATSKKIGSVTTNFVRRNVSSMFGLFGTRRNTQQKQKGIPMSYYIGLSILRSVDMASTNLAMRYVNYPAKTLVKSSRVAFTMFMGIFIGRKRYSWRDYAVVGLLVSGLLIFFDADSKVDSATFHPVGVGLLILSLICDGAVSNSSEQLMNLHDVSQDEFLFYLYLISFGMLFLASQRDGEFWSGVMFMLQPGTVDEWKHQNVVHAGAGGGGAGAAELIAIANGQTFAATASHTGAVVWTSAAKISALLLFATTGMLGSSCASAITKHFGALSMSITSTARKGLTLFLSFALFPNTCTAEHGAGIGLFLTSLAMKSCLRANSAPPKTGKATSKQSRKSRAVATSA